MENRCCRRNPELPDVIIQHIQSFLKTKEAAETMLVSKSWLRSWSTRPFLIFDYVSNKLIDRTLKSYVEKGISIVRFQLRVDTIKKRWLKMARQSNVINLDLTARMNWRDTLFQEIFLTKSLQVLRIVFDELNYLIVLCHSNIKCLNLRKLEFENLKIDEVIFHHIMSYCPLIEELLLSSCTLIDFFSYNIGSQSCIFAGECASLKRLSLIYTEINDEQLQAILSKSPRLEYLNIIRCSMLVKSINLSSVNLKRVNLDMSDIYKSDMKLVLNDAPNLLKLKCRSCSFMTIPFPITNITRKERGAVKVTLVYNYLEIDESWFHRLREFLAKFDKSHVKFTLVSGNLSWIDYELQGATLLPLLNEVESLRIKGYKVFQLLYSFFTICHPKIVLLDRLDTISDRKLLIELLKGSSYKGNLECCSFYQNKCWRHYIEDVKLYYVVDNEKKSLDMNELETGSGYLEAITLDLEWKCSY